MKELLHGFNCALEIAQSTPILLSPILPAIFRLLTEKINGVLGGDAGKDL